MENLRISNTFVHLKEVQAVFAAHMAYNVTTRILGLQDNQHYQKGKLLIL